MFFFRRVMLIRSCRNYSKSSSPSNDLYILSAVRTPFGLCNGVLNQFTAPQLFSLVFREALQRAVVPSEDVFDVFLGCFSSQNFNENILKRTGLSKSVRISWLSTFGIQNFINGAKFLLTNDQNVCVVGGAVSRSNDIENEEDTAKKAKKHFLLNQQLLGESFKFDYKNYMTAQKNGEFYDEIAKIVFRKKGQQITVTDDELPVNNLHFNYKNELGTDIKYLPMFTDGAAAFVIASEDYVQQNNLTPIAKIVSFAQESVNADEFPQSQLLVVEKALKIGGCQFGDISQWEIDPAINADNFLEHFKVDPSLVNKSGGVLTLGYPIGLSGATALCHLTHSVSFGSLGCVTSCDFSGTASSIIIKKYGGKCFDPPRLTLFTKKLCPLCDELKLQLKPFQGRFLLHEVDIESDENKKYRELYKYEIPVLFLEGRFLCKHQLEAQHFDRRLLEFENSRIDKYRSKE